MKYRVLCLGAIAVIVTALTAIGLPRATHHSPPTRAAEDAARARHAARVTAVSLLDSGRTEAAREVIRPMIENPSNDFDAVEGRRLMSMSHRADRNFADANVSLDAALAAFDARPALRRYAPGLRARIVLDQADIAAFSERDSERAIRLYDQVFSHTPPAERSEAKTAARNAAMLCASQGRYGEAIERADRLLASEAAAELTATDVLLLRVSQASWAAENGDLPGAFSRYQSVWNEYGQRSDPAVFDAGIRVAKWYPVPQECAARFRILHALLEKIDAARRAPAAEATDTPSATELNEIEQQTLVAIADSGGCDTEQALVRWARNRLGLRD